MTEKYFKASPHYIALSEMGVPRCVDCHDNHAILYPSADMFSSEEDGHCGSCHDTESNQYKTAQEIRSLLETASGNVARMEQELADIEHSGRNLSDLQTLTEEARTYLTEVLPITHTLSLDRIEEKTSRAIENAEKLLQKVDEFKGELRARKRSLLLILGIILLTIAFLYFKLRSLPHP